MSKEILIALETDDFDERGGFYWTPNAIIRHLDDQPEVVDLQIAIHDGRVTEEEIAVWVKEKLVELRLNYGFRYNLAFAAVAVAVAAEGSESLRESYLHGLSRVQLTEMRLCVGVARRLLGWTQT